MAAGSLLNDLRSPSDLWPYLHYANVFWQLSFPVIKTNNGPCNQKGNQ